MTVLVALPGLLMLLAILLPGHLATRHRSQLIRCVFALTSVNLAVAIASLLTVAMDGAQLASLIPPLDGHIFSLSIWLNGTSALMLVLVSFISWIVARFSNRYLDGESETGRYFQWLAVTTGAISLTVLAANLLFLLVCLLLTSIGMSRLLTHYRDRQAAQSAASLKFGLSRLGDLFLLMGTVALYQATGTLELPLLTDAVSRAVDSGPETALQFAAWMLVLCAFCKSAQFPFHTWLPDTMEAPTPVSALMHAGVVNAGGYLLIRTAPVVVQAPSAMTAAIIVGALTAAAAAVVMLTQSSVKRSLAWSTVAQMGFMILQCGLGAFSAAMLHLIAHSLYKAWAFLSSGDVLNQPAKAASTAPGRTSSLTESVRFTVAALAVPAVFLVTAQLAGVSLSEKPGGFLLGFVLCLGLVRSLATTPMHRWSFVATLTGGVALLTTLYFGLFTLVDGLVANAGVAVTATASIGFLMPTIAGLWLLMVLLEIRMPHAAGSPWLQRLYVHSRNGFYIDVFWKQLTRTMTS